MFKVDNILGLQNDSKFEHVLYVQIVVQVEFKGVTAQKNLIPWKQLTKNDLLFIHDFYSASIRCLHK